MTQARLLFFGLAVIYLAGVGVQFFLAGLGTFGAASFDAHSVFGLFLVLMALILLVVAFVGKLPRSLRALTFVLLAVNVLQIFLAQLDVEELAAFHVVNALAIAFIGYEVMERSRRYLAWKLGPGD
ncbi:MAG: DUF6220 domain-containing protein [Gaiellaceae bacterium]